MFFLWWVPVMAGTWWLYLHGEHTSVFWREKKQVNCMIMSKLVPKLGECFCVYADASRHIGPLPGKQGYNNSAGCFRMKRVKWCKPYRVCILSLSN